MINRIVKMTFQEDKLEDFIKIWEGSRKKIAARDGCYFVEMMQSVEPRNICFTYSVWENEEALNAYRNSDLFKGVWKKTKALFDDKPQAWSTESHGFGGELIKKSK